jgi:hypothetical protein
MAKAHKKQVKVRGAFFGRTGEQHTPQWQKDIIKDRVDFSNKFPDGTESEKWKPTQKQVEILLNNGCTRDEVEAMSRQEAVDEIAAIFKQRNWNP